MRADIYQTALLRLAARASGAGRLADADGSAAVDNPLCGDRIVVDVKVEGGKVAAVGYEVRACVVCQAMASVLGQDAPGAPVAEAAALEAAAAAMLKDGAPAPQGRFAELAAFEPVSAVKARWECVLLPLRALRRAVAGGDG